MTSKLIAGVKFVAVRKDHPIPHWRYKVGDREGPQGYSTRPAMWADLERAATCRGDRWCDDWKKFGEGA